MRFELGKLELFGFDLGSLWHRWWRGINSLLPVPLSVLFLHDAPRIRVGVHDISQTLRIESIVDDRLCESLELGFAETSLLDERSLFEQLTKSYSKKKFQLDLVLPESQVVRRLVKIPLAARQDLRQVVGFQISRLTPFTREQVLYDVLPGDVDEAAGMLNCELVMVPRRFAQTWMDEVSRIVGLPVARLQVPSTADALSMGNLLGRTAVPSAWYERLNKNSFLAVMLLLCVGLVAVAPTFKLRYLVLQGKQQIAELDKRVSETRREWYELQREAESLEFVVSQYSRNGSMVAILDELSRVLPDTVFLTSFSLSNGRVTLGGEGTQVVELIDLLNNSAMFEQARFASAVTRSTNNLDVFNITARLAGQGESQ